MLAQQTDSASNTLALTSIVIPVRDDPLLHRCLDSVDEAVEVVVVCNGSPSGYIHEIRREHKNILIVELPDPGIGAAYNAGIRTARGRYILLMDSDCIFAQGTIRKLAVGMRRAPISKGRVLFSASNRWTRLTAKARRVLEDPLETGKVNAYSPPLLYDREIVASMGGYHFHDLLSWREDRDFELRRRAAGIDIDFSPDACITHKDLTVAADLRSVYNYGKAETIGRAIGALPREKTADRVAKTLRTAARIAAQTRSATLLTYFAARRMTFGAGRILAILEKRSS